jgi:ribose 5-phosphate isomerase B
VTEADVRNMVVGGELHVPPGTVITPLARDVARERRIELVVEQAGGPLAEKALQSLPRSQDRLRTGLPAQDRVVALGADHGGYGMKDDLKGYVSELGYQVVDCGTHGTSSVDYPDFAYAVARLVSEGRAWRGIIIDGAGIGSCMAANKVPGARAALCYDHATALNSREHNDANVLTLGAMLLGPSLARQIVKVWLETDFGGGRHARRVDKIMGIEQRFSRK